MNVRYDRSGRKNFGGICGHSSVFLLNFGRQKERMDEVIRVLNAVHGECDAASTSMPHVLERDFRRTPPLSALSFTVIKGKLKAKKKVSTISSTRYYAGSVSGSESKLWISRT